MDKRQVVGVSREYMPVQLNPWLVCEGECERPRPHHYVHTTKVSESGTRPPHYEQMFVCSACGHERMWGLYAHVSEVPLHPGDEAAAMTA